MRDDIEEQKLPSFNTTSSKEHVPEIEQTIEFLKEKMRDLTRFIPYHSLPRRIVIEMV